VRIKRIQRLDWLKKQALHFQELQNREKRAHAGLNRSANMENFRQSSLGKVVAEMQIEKLRAEISDATPKPVTKEESRIIRWGKKIGIVNLSDY
jgi:predicted  nucleic acid-binding Zn-ribbon protein